MTAYDLALLVERLASKYGWQTQVYVLPEEPGVIGNGTNLRQIELVTLEDVVDYGDVSRIVPSFDPVEDSIKPHQAIVIRVKPRATERRG